MSPKRIDIIGNGDSNNLYVPNAHYTIACNIPQHTIKYNALSIIDNRPLDFMKERGWKPRVPVFCTPEVQTRSRKFNLEGDWFAVYERKHRWNAGHHAVLHHNTMAQQIHLWGFDSLFSQDLTSQTDAIIPRHHRPPLNNHWHPIWREILDQCYCTVVLHLPQGAKCAIEHEKLRTESHRTEDLAISTEHTQQTA